MVNNLINTITILKEKLTYPFKYLHGFIVEESVSLNVEEHVLKCEALPLTCISTNYMEPIYSSSMETIYPILLDLVIGYEDIPLAYVSMDMVEQQNFMEY